MNTNIVTCADDNYALPLAVLLKSIEETTTTNHTVDVIEVGITETNKQKIIESVDNDKLEIVWHSFPIEKIENFKTYNHISTTAYTKIFLPELFPTADKIIFLDSDLILNHDINELVAMDFEYYYGVAVPECDINALYMSSPNAVKCYGKLGIDPKTKFFNTGMMILNCKKWVEDDITNKIIAYLIKYEEYVHLCDQDGINAVTKGYFKELNPQWNQLSQLFSFDAWEDSPYDEQTYNKVKDDPYIVHFNTQNKPWKHTIKHPYQQLFLKHLSNTKFK